MNLNLNRVKLKIGVPQPELSAKGRGIMMAPGRFESESPAGGRHPESCAPAHRRLQSTAHVGRTS